MSAEAACHRHAISDRSIEEPVLRLPAKGPKGTGTGPWCEGESESSSRSTGVLSTSIAPCLPKRAGRRTSRCPMIGPADMVSLFVFSWRGACTEFPQPGGLHEAVPRPRTNRRIACGTTAVRTHERGTAVGSRFRLNHSRPPWSMDTLQDVDLHSSA